MIILPVNPKTVSGGIINFITDTYDLVMPDHVYAIEGDGTDLTTEYNPEGTAKEFTAEEAAIYGDIEALHERQYQETYDMLVSMGVSEEEAEKMARETIDETSAAHEALLESNEQYIKDVQEKEAQEFAEREAEFKEIYGMSYEEFDNLTWQEQNELTRELVRSGKLPKGGVG